MSSLFPSPGYRQLGYQQITSLGTAVGLTIPPGATYALLQAETANIRWTDDGVTAPTSSIGMLLESTATEPSGYAGNLNNLKFIAASGSPKLNISYYG